MRRWQRLCLGAVLVALLVGLSAGPALAAQSDGFLYTVQWGDSIWSLSQRFGVPAAAIRQANGLWDGMIYAGQVLWIPTGVSGAAATAANTAVGATSWEVELLARLISAEARGEPYAGQVAVGAVVLNRVKSGIFPNTIAGVIYDPWQFEPVQNGQIYLPPTPSAWKAVQDALRGWDPSGGALYFFNPAKAGNSYLWSKVVTAWIGSHVFLR